MTLSRRVHIADDLGGQVDPVHHGSVRSGGCGRSAPIPSLPPRPPSGVACSPTMSAASTIVASLRLVSCSTNNGFRRECVPDAVPSDATETQRVPLGLDRAVAVEREITDPTCHDQRTALLPGTIVDRSLRGQPVDKWLVISLAGNAIP